MFDINMELFSKPVLTLILSKLLPVIAILAAYEKSVQS